MIVQQPARDARCYSLDDGAHIFTPPKYPIPSFRCDGIIIHLTERMLKIMKNPEEEMNRIYIKEPMKKYLKTDEPEDMFMLLANIAVRINRDGTAPSPVMTETRIVLGFDPDMELEDFFPPEDEPVMTSCLITEEDGTRWLPLFTDQDELGSMGKENTVEDRPILDIITDAFEDDSIAGLVINPYSDALSFRKELLYVILQLLKEDDPGLG